MSKHAFRVSIVSYIIFMLIINLVFSEQGQANNEDVNEQTRQKQYNTRDTNRMNYENVQSYTIKSEGVDSFHLAPQVDQEVKCELYVYWKQANIFISSEYREGQEIRVLIYQDEQRILFDRSFYMVNGFSFNVRKGSTYQIRFLSSGRIKKLVSLTISKMLDVSESLVDKDDLLKSQQKIDRITGQIQSFFSISQRNYIMQQRLTAQVLKSTRIYMGYEIVQIMLVLIIAIIQTVFITKVLNTHSIV